MYVSVRVILRNEKLYRELVQFAKTRISEPNCPFALVTNILDI